MHHGKASHKVVHAEHHHHHKDGLSKTEEAGDKAAAKLADGAWTNVPHSAVAFASDCPWPAYCGASLLEQLAEMSLPPAACEAAVAHMRGHQHARAQAEKARPDSGRRLRKRGGDDAGGPTHPDAPAASGENGDTDAKEAQTRRALAWVVMRICALGPDWVSTIEGLSALVGFADAERGGAPGFHQGNPASHGQKGENGEAVADGGVDPVGPHKFAAASLMSKEAKEKLGKNTAAMFTSVGHGRAAHAANMAAAKAEKLAKTPPLSAQHASGRALAMWTANAISGAAGLLLRAHDGSITVCGSHVALSLISTIGEVRSSRVERQKYQIERWRAHQMKKWQAATQRKKGL